MVSVAGCGLGLGLGLGDQAVFDDYVGGVVLSGYSGVTEDQVGHPDIMPGFAPPSP